MSAWLEAYEKLPEAQKGRVQRWIHLQKLVAETLRIDFDRWIEDYVGGAMKAPFDYRFMEVTVPDFAGLDVEGATFTKDTDPATARTARVPIRAKNQLGRLSPGLQEGFAGLLEGTHAEAIPVPPSDVVTLQKLFPSEKPLAKLKRKDFRRVELSREGNDILCGLSGEPAEVLFRLELFEGSAILDKPNL